MASETCHTDALQSWVFCLNGAHSVYGESKGCRVQLFLRIGVPSVDPEGSSRSLPEFLREKSVLAGMKLFSVQVLIHSECLCVRASLSTSSWPMASVGCSLSISGLPLSLSRQLSGGSALPAQLFFFPKGQKFEKS